MDHAGWCFVKLSNNRESLPIQRYCVCKTCVKLLSTCLYYLYLVAVQVLYVLAGCLSRNSPAGLPININLPKNKAFVKHLSPWYYRALTGAHPLVMYTYFCLFIFASFEHQLDKFWYKICTTSIDVPCRELSNGGLIFVVALSICWQIVLCPYRESNPTVLIHSDNVCR